MAASEPIRAAAVAARLARGGFVAAEEEAAELVARAGDDDALLAALVERRLTGEPLAWITGEVRFCGLRLRVDPGVYVPRWHTEALVRRAVARLPADGAAVDLCTGTGAVAAAVSAARPRARVVASDLDPCAVACARANGVDARAGDLFAPLPSELRGAVDVVAGVVPYVPRGELRLLQRDTFAFESTIPYDGGDDGTAILRRVVRAAPAWLRPGGALLLELGGAQRELLAPELTRHGFAGAAVLRDEEGDVRGVEATWDPDRVDARINHVSISARDLGESVEFYVELLGAEPLPTPNFGLPVQWLALGRTQLHLFERDVPSPTHHHFGITVDDLEPVFRAAERRGAFERGTFGNHLVELPGDVVQLYLRDPVGNLVEIDQHGVDRLPDDLRAQLRGLWDLNPQSEENLRGRLFVPE